MSFRPGGTLTLAIDEGMVGSGAATLTAIAEGAMLFLGGRANDSKMLILLWIFQQRSHLQFIKPWSLIDKANERIVKTKTHAFTAIAPLLRMA